MESTEVMVHSTKCPVHPFPSPLSSPPPEKIESAISTLNDQLAQLIDAEKMVYTTRCYYYAKNNSSTSLGAPCKTSMNYNSVHTIYIYYYVVASPLYMRMHPTSNIGYIHYSMPTATQYLSMQGCCQYVYSLSPHTIAWPGGQCYV